MVSPTIVNDARVGYYRRVNTTTVPRFGDNWAQKLGIPNVGPELDAGFGGSNTTRYSPETHLWHLRRHAEPDGKRNALVPQRHSWIKRAHTLSRSATRCSGSG